MNNDPTPEQRERLLLLADAAGRVQREITMLLRFGYSPGNMTQTNQAGLETALGRLQAAQWAMTEHGDLSAFHIGVAYHQWRSGAAHAAQQAAIKQHELERLRASLPAMIPTPGELRAAGITPEGCVACRSLKPPFEIGERCVVCQRELIAGSTER